MPKEPEETVSISKKDFESLMSRVNSLEDSKRAYSDDDIPTVGGFEGDREFTCRVKTLNGRPLVEIRNVIDHGKDKFGKDVMTCTACTAEKDGTVKEHKDADYTALIYASAEVCKIVGVERKPRTEKGPIVTIKVWDDSKQTEVTTGKKVRGSINFIDEIFKVEWNGEIFKTKELNVPN